MIDARCSLMISNILRADERVDRGNVCTANFSAVDREGVVNIPVSGVMYPLIRFSLDIRLVNAFSRHCTQPQPADDSTCAFGMPHPYQEDPMRLQVLLGTPECCCGHRASQYDHALSVQHNKNHFLRGPISSCMQAGVPLTKWDATTRDLLLENV